MTVSGSQRTFSASTVLKLVRRDAKFVGEAVVFGLYARRKLTQSTLETCLHGVFSVWNTYVPEMH